jgi:glycyl-tRNA synthetase beta chain
MSVADFLFELGTEELPPKALKNLSAALEASLVKQLNDANIAFEAVASFAAPRRLAVKIDALALSQPDEAFERKGPAVKSAFDADGNATKALLGFCRGLKIEPDALERIDTKKGEWLIYKGVKQGQATENLIADFVQKALNALPIAKKMRWGSSRTEFVRPVKWVLMMLDGKTVDAEILSLKTGNTSRGHRIHAPADLVIESAQSYEQQLKDVYVMADFAKRHAIVKQQVTDIAKTVGGIAVIDADLLDEVTALNEWPTALIGKFDEEFLTVAPEALISSMKEHQKYFHVVDADGQLKANFITVANIESSDPQQVVEGNEKVIRPRLGDAKFFWDTDRKKTLADRTESLKTVLFQKDLGTVFDKSQRIKAVASFIAAQTGGNVEWSERAAELAKCDLMTEMVYEFPDLQGLSGFYYAQNDGEAAEVALTMNEHYLPAFAGDDLPSCNTAIAVALADRLDTLVGIFGIGMVPTGSKDPFALRRSSLGVLRILVEKEVDIDLRTLLTQALAQHKDLKNAETVVEQLISYMLDRFSAWYADEGIAAEVFQSVRLLNPENPLDINQRVQAVNKFKALPEAESLAAANKRVSNFLAKLDGDLAQTEVNESLFVEQAERDLFAALNVKAAEVAPLFEARDYTRALESLASLREPVDVFFLDLKVMADDEAVKNNRLALLSQLRNLFLQVADLAVLS